MEKENIKVDVKIQLSIISKVFSMDFADYLEVFSILNDCIREATNQSNDCRLLDIKPDGIRKKGAITGYTYNFYPPCLIGLIDYDLLCKNMEEKFKSKIIKFENYSIYRISVNQDTITIDINKTEEGIIE